MSAIGSERRETFLLPLGVGLSVDPGGLANGGGTPR
jgi:hypothetical protein